jgi:hypothetical protein
MAAPKVSIPDPTSGKPPPARRWIPQSLQLFVAVLVILGVASISFVGVPAYHQQAAIREIERVGGRFRTNPIGPAWLRGLVGNQWMKAFDEVVEVDLSTQQATDATLSRLGRLRNIKWLRLDYTHLTDAGLVHLKGMTKLAQLYLNCTRVTDAGLEHLNGLSSLESLWLANTQVTDSGLAHLKGLTRLQSLVLGRTKVTDAGLQHLNALTNLETLALDNTQITRAGVAKLKREMLPHRVIITR